MVISQKATMETREAPIVELRQLQPVRLTLSEIIHKYAKPMRPNVQITTEDNNRSQEATALFGKIPPASCDARPDSQNSEGVPRIHKCLACELHKGEIKPPSAVLRRGSGSSPSPVTTPTSASTDRRRKRGNPGGTIYFKTPSKSSHKESNEDKFAKTVANRAHEWRIKDFPNPINFYGILFKKTVVTKAPK